MKSEIVDLQYIIDQGIELKAGIAVKSEERKIYVTLTRETMQCDNPGFEVTGVGQSLEGAIVEALVKAVVSREQFHKAEVTRRAGWIIAEALKNLAIEHKEGDGKIDKRQRDLVKDIVIQCDLSNDQVELVYAELEAGTEVRNQPSRISNQPLPI